MKTTLYCTARSDAQTELIVTALHATGFGPSDISILGDKKGEPRGKGSSQDVMSHLESMGVPKDEAELYSIHLAAGTYLVVVGADSDEQVAAAKRVLQAAEPGSVRVLSPEVVAL